MAARRRRTASLSSVYPPPAAASIFTMPVANPAWSSLHERARSLYRRRSGRRIFCSRTHLLFPAGLDQPQLRDGSDRFAATHQGTRAVARLLINPDSAEFGSLRSVEVEKAKYVCGAVRAKDCAGY